MTSTELRSPPSTRTIWHVLVVLLAGVFALIGGVAWAGWVETCFWNIMQVGAGVALVALLMPPLLVLINRIARPRHRLRATSAWLVLYPMAMMCLFTSDAIVGRSVFGSILQHLFSRLFAFSVLISYLGGLAFWFYTESIFVSHRGSAVWQRVTLANGRLDPKRLVY
jgi:hypothetical protein